MYYITEIHQDAIGRAVQRNWQNRNWVSVTETLMPLIDFFAENGPDNLEEDAKTLFDLAYYRALHEDH
jgi:hypothetical protein